MNIHDEKSVRLKKLESLKAHGIYPYPAKVSRTHTCLEAIRSFNALSTEHAAITLVGRIMLFRSHGGATFFTIMDGTERMQAFASKKVLGDDYRVFKLTDMGDFVQVSGTLFTTKKGEKTLQIEKFRLISKALRPLPDKWHGLVNEDERYRRRYLDILTAPSVKEIFIKKSIFWNAVRQFLQTEGFLEVETPVLENTTGGADAEPFVTHHNALDIDVYLRISCGELWQKMLMVAGFEKTFEIGRIFRNEGMDYEHLQDYTQMEFYWAYADYEQGMSLVERMFREVIGKTFGTLTMNVNGFDIDLGAQWKRFDYREEIFKCTGIDIDTANFGDMQRKLDELGVKYHKLLNKSRGMDYLWKYCRKKIAGPGFLVNIPRELSPLAKSKESDPRFVERYQVIIAGSELGNGYTELNDPLDQKQRFMEQNALRDAGDKEAHMYSHEFIEALEYGMPPTTGFGLSERVFAYFMNTRGRDAVLFPLMRPLSPDESRDVSNDGEKFSKGE